MLFLEGKFVSFAGKTSGQCWRNVNFNLPKKILRVVVRMFGKPKLQRDDDDAGCFVNSSFNFRQLTVEI